MRFHGTMVIAAVLVAACFSERGEVAGPEGDCVVPVDAFGRGRAVVIIRGFAFHPDTLAVAAGTVVTWVNCEEPGTDSHTTTSETDVWNSGALADGDTFAQEFDEAGEFGYFCVPHPFMRGAILVGQPPGTLPAFHIAAKAIEVTKQEEPDEVPTSRAVDGPGAGAGDRRLRRGSDGGGRAARRRGRGR